MLEGKIESLQKVHTDLKFTKLSHMKVAQSCPTLRDHMDYTVRGILQARILERVAFLFSRESSQPRDRTQVSRTGLQNCYHNKTIHRIFL